MTWTHRSTARFENRSQAGAKLAEALREFAGRADVIALGLPRGGVVVAGEVATRLGLARDVLVVRKLGHPLRKELAVGAIAAGGVAVMNPGKGIPGLTGPDLERVMARELAELERRERAYRTGRPPLRLEGMTAILIDDGLATGATLRAAILASHRLACREVVAAVPVGYAAGLAELTRPPYNARTVCVLSIVEPASISEYYASFGQTSDEEVRAILAEASAREQGRSAVPASAG